MAKVKLEVDGYQCERCGHEWIARGTEEPRVCPKCKSPYWNVPKKIKELIPLHNNNKNNDNKSCAEQCRGAEELSPS